MRHVRRTPPSQAQINHIGNGGVQKVSSVPILYQRRFEFIAVCAGVQRQNGAFMLNYIWAFMIIISIVTAAFNGRLDAVAIQAMEASKTAVMSVLSLTGAMCLWSGLLKIAELGGLTRALSKLLRPVVRLLFPSIDPNSKAAAAIVSNISANMLGMGNAATPFGIKAMQELSALNRGSVAASDAMCMFVVINTASVQLIPTTMLAILGGAGAQNPFDIIIPTLISSFLTLIFGTFTCFVLSGGRHAQKRSRTHKK